MSGVFAESVPVRAGEVLRIPFPSWHEFQSFDPVILNRDYSAEFFNLVAKPIVYIDHTNQIKPGIAEKFRWRKNILILDIRENIRTASGHLLTASDVSLSLRRAIVIGRKRVGKNIAGLCPPDHINPREKCTSIRQTAKFRLELEFQEKNPSVVWELTDHALSIFPITAFNEETNRIQNFYETVGPYYIESIDQKNWKFILRANRGHWLISDESPKTIEVSSYDLADGDSIKRQFLLNKFDLIPMVNELYKGQMLEISKLNKNKLHTSEEILVMAFKFTNRGMKLAKDIRRQIAKVLIIGSNNYLSNINQDFSKYWRQKNQLLPSGAFGSLPDNTLEKNRSELMRTKITIKKQNQFELAMAKHTLKSFKKILGDGLGYFKLSGKEHHFSFENIPGSDSSIPHVTVVGLVIDSRENLSSIKFLADTEIFHRRMAESAAWYEIYSKVESQVDREKMLQKLHLESLYQNISVVPLLSKPFLAVGTESIDISVFPKNKIFIPYWLL